MRGMGRGVRLRNRDLMGRMGRATPTDDVVVLIKAIHCYEYQSCEHDEWEKSKAADYCTALESMLVHELPGYDAAPWGID
jgi:hypothetical protein